MGYGQLACLGLGAGGPKEIRQIARVLGAPRYQQYFDRIGYSLAARWGSIQRDFPELTGRPVGPRSPTEEIVRAFADEVRSGARSRRRAAVVVSNPQLTGGRWRGRQWVRFDLDPGLDQAPELERGQEVHVLSMAGERLMATRVGAVRMASRHLFLVVRSPKVFELPSHGIVEPAPRRITELFGRRVERLLDAEPMPFGVTALFDSRGWDGPPMSGETREVPVFDEGALNDRQWATVRACLRRRVTPVWGPPGTGKTHTLVRLLLSLAFAEERVLVVAPSNVAIDQVALRLIELAGRHPQVRALLDQRKVVRLGYPKLAKVVECDALYPDLAEIEDLTRQIEMHRVAIEKLEAQEAADPANARLMEARASLQLEVKTLIGRRDQATRAFVECTPVVLTTTHIAGIGAVFEQVHPYHTVIIDEASMVSLPYAIPAVARATERVVFFGDFQQLAPVVQAATDVADRWLRPDLFEATGLVAAHHDRMELTAHGKAMTQMLTTQHRMHPHIAAVSGTIFYDDRLATAPFQGRAPAWIEALPRRALMVRLMPGVDAGEVAYTRGGSRYNAESAALVARLVRQIVHDAPETSVAVVSPYRAQTERLRTHLADLEGSLQIGTVHAMQGSEADIVLWDLVDVRDSQRRVRAGCLYRGTAGNRLFNVALTRARALVMLLGDPDTFTDLDSGVHSMASAIQQQLLHPISYPALLQHIPEGPGEGDEPVYASVG